MNMILHDNPTALIRQGNTLTIRCLQKMGGSRL